MTKNYNVTTIQVSRRIVDMPKRFVYLETPMELIDTYDTMERSSRLDGAIRSLKIKTVDDFLKFNPEYFSIVGKNNVSATTAAQFISLQKSLMVIDSAKYMYRNSVGQYKNSFNDILTGDTVKYRNRNEHRILGPYHPWVLRRSEITASWAKNTNEFVVAEDSSNEDMHLNILVYNAISRQVDRILTVSKAEFVKVKK